MSYTPTEWKNGDTITAEKLNKIESGIKEGSEVLFVKWKEGFYDQGMHCLDKTWGELYDAIASGKAIYFLTDGEQESYNDGSTYYAFEVFPLDSFTLYINNYYRCSIQFKNGTGYCCDPCDGIDTRLSWDSITSEEQLYEIYPYEYD